MDWLCGHFRRQHLLAIFGQGNALQSTDVLLLNSRVCGLSYIPRQFGFYSLFFPQSENATHHYIARFSLNRCLLYRRVFISKKKGFQLSTIYIHSVRRRQIMPKYTYIYYILQYAI
jgi:hypothetical protein